MYQGVTMQYFSNYQDENGVNNKTETLQPANTDNRNINDKKKKKGFLHRLFVTVILLFSLLILCIGILMLIGIIDKKPIAAVTPDNFSMHVYVDNVYKLVQTSLDTKAVDMILAGASLGTIRSALQDLKKQPFIHSKYFKMLANFPVYASVYADNSFLIVADLGIRSGFTRLIPLFLPLVQNKIPELKKIDEENISYFVFESNTNPIFFYFDKNLIIGSNSKKLLKTAVLNNHNSELVKNIIANKPFGLFSISVRANELSSMISASNDPILEKIFDYTSFSDIITINFNLNNEGLYISTNIPFNKDAQGSMKPILYRHSKVPGFLNYLPDTCVYSTVFSAGTPQELWQAAADLLSPAIINSKQKADTAMSLLLGFNSDELLFSWTGNEFGMFSLAESVDHVFFIKIADEKKRKNVFEKVFSNFFIDEKSNIMIDGIRMTRIEFPDYLRALLEQFKVTLIEPYFVVYNNYLLLSSSAETLAKIITKHNNNTTLTKSESWNMLPLGNSDSMIFVFYNLNYTTPALFRSFPSVIQSILKLYRLGTMKISSSGTALQCAISAIPIQQEGLAELEGFPIETGTNPETSIDGGLNNRGKPFLIWTSDTTIVSINLLTKEQYMFNAGRTVYITVEKSGTTIKTIWAITDNGTIYQFNEKLEKQAEFALTTNSTISVNPFHAGKKLFIPASSNLIAVEPDGSQSLFPELPGKIKNLPAVSQDWIAVAPRTFEGEIYLFNYNGTIANGYPFITNALPACSPYIIDSNGSNYVLACTETKAIYCIDANGELMSGYPVTLTGKVIAGPRWIPDWNVYTVITDDNVLWKINLSGSIISSTQLTIQTGKPADIFVLNIDKKNSSEILVTTTGNAVYAYDNSLFSVPGFPISGYSKVLLYDADGNGSIDIITIGTNGGIHAYSY